MLILILFIGMALFIYYYILKTTADEQADPDIILEMKRNIQPYSGLHEELFIQYMNNLDMFKTNIEYTEIASKYLYNALENIYDLQLYEQDFDFTPIIHQNAVMGEEMLLDSSLKHGTSFHPKYLNK